ncbi:MAG: DUF1501 domain-containing protein [Fuerstiella sp.]|nr:DUF1501 domain-containing protein [Fuerstiella sp.]
MRLCDSINRRELMRVGGLSTLGLTMHDMLQVRSAQAGVAARHSKSFGRAKRCIFLYMWGGPPHIDTFDPKPEAPVGIRGEFSPIETNVPGVYVSDHLPWLAEHADKYAIVRSVNHADSDHISASHDLLTGNTYPRVSNFITARRTDHPHIGAVLAKLKPQARDLPPYVQLPCLLKSNSGKVITGQYGGFLGKRYDPFIIDAVPNKEPTEDPEFTQFVPRSMQFEDGHTSVRLDGVRNLVETLDSRARELGQSLAARELDSLKQQAFSLLCSERVRNAFDLSAEEPQLRDRYGQHTFGQEVLFARRLVEVGVPLVTVYWRNGPPRTDIGWDNHINNFPNLKNWQLPPVDRAFSALLEDLSQRGLLDETLVVWMGEFGRSPRIDSRGGRNHWPRVFSVVMAGGGIRGGQVYGASDEIGAYPKDYPVSPHDIGATIFHLLGIDTNQMLRDASGRPHYVCHGDAISGLI